MARAAPPSPAATITAAPLSPATTFPAAFSTVSTITAAPPFHAATISTITAAPPFHAATIIAAPPSPATTAAFPFPAAAISTVSTALPVVSPGPLARSLCSIVNARAIAHVFSAIPRCRSSSSVSRASI